nr:hypothetical protein [Pedobacter sp. ASV2]
MHYNLFVKFNVGGFTILDINQTQLDVVLSAYKLGKQKFTLSGVEHDWGLLGVLKIYTNEANMSETEIIELCRERGRWVKIFGAGHIISPEFLNGLGKDVTYDFLGNNPFGGNEAEAKGQENFINIERINDLRSIQSNSFDFSKLIILCIELNSNWKIGNYYTVGLLLRTIINHVPPLFGNFTTFLEVCANYGNQSFKKNMNFLNISLRSIADSYTHDLIRKKEILPNSQQVDFRPNVDLLLAEVVRINK